MSRLIFVIALLLTLLLPMAKVSAQDQFDPYEEACLQAPESEVCQIRQNPENPLSGEEGILVKVLNVFSFVIGVTSVLMVILGGLKYITSNGDSTAITNAKNTILYALIGLVVFLFSQVIIRFVISNL
jgi:hypothetical protein